MMNIKKPLTKKKMKLKCSDCKLEFDINILTGRLTITKEVQLCCPSCQSKVKKR